MLSSPTAAHVKVTGSPASNGPIVGLPESEEVISVIKPTLFFVLGIYVEYILYKLYYINWNF